MAGKVFTGEEVAQHNTRESCWIIVHGEFGTHFWGVCVLAESIAHGRGYKQAYAQPYSGEGLLVISLWCAQGYLS